jgi:hypothetical protein
MVLCSASLSSEGCEVWEWCCWVGWGGEWCVCELGVVKCVCVRVWRCVVWFGGVWCGVCVEGMVGYGGESGCCGAVCCICVVDVVRCGYSSRFGVEVWL